MQTQKFKIEIGIPMPRAVTKFPLLDMRVGDSFLVSKDGAYQLHNAIAAHHSKKLGFRFKTKSIGDGVRCWRIE